jgi:superfamily II DNA or RNA helicase
MALEPAELGARFHQACTVTLVEHEQPCHSNGWQRRQVPNEMRNYWYDTHPKTGRRVFYCLSGYGQRITDTLKGAGIDVTEEDLMPSGLPEPRFDLVQNVEWRGNQAGVLANMLASRNGVIHCPTGWGKSFLLYQIMRLYPDSKIIFTVPSKDVAREIYDSLRRYDPEIGFVGDGEVNPQRVTVAISHSLKHCDKNAALLIGDECHSLVSEMFRNVLVQFRRAKFLGMTASPEGRSDNGDGFIEALFGPKIAEIEYDEAVQSGNVVPLKVWAFECRKGPDVTGLDRKDLKDRAGIWNNLARNQLITIATHRALAEYGEDAQVLIMVDKAEHAYRLQQLMPEFTVVTGEIDADRAQELQKDGALLPGQLLCTTKDRKRYKADFASGKLRRVIATFVWSKGVNFQDLNILVRADGLGSEIHSTQVPGRLSRLGSEKQKTHGLLIDFIDRFSSDLESRSQNRLRVYRKHGWQIQKIS